MQKKDFKKDVAVLDESMPYKLMDAEDEKQILAEMRGEIIDTFVYSFVDRSGKEITGLSKVGIDNVCRESASKGEVFRVIDEPVIKEDDKAVNVVVKVGRYLQKPDGKEIMLDTTFGAKREEKFRNNRFNPFFFETAMSKAERNAKRKLMPENLIIEMIKKYKQQGKVKTVKQPQPQPVQSQQKPQVEVYKMNSSSPYISNEQAKLLVSTREKYENDTLITHDALVSMLKAYYNVNQWKEIKKEDFQAIFKAVQSRESFDKLCDELECNRIEKENNV